MKKYLIEPVKTAPVVDYRGYQASSVTAPARKEARPCGEFVVPLLFGCGLSSVHPAAAMVFVWRKQRLFIPS